MSSSFYCYGPGKPPIEMNAAEQATWHAHTSTPVKFNHHQPVEINSTTIRGYDLNPIMSTTEARKEGEKVLILTPLRDAAAFLPKHFDLISQLEYPHELIDLGFLVSDSTDDTLALLSAELERIQAKEDKTSFRSVTIVEKDFGSSMQQNDVEDRHSFEAQPDRRKLLGRARNYLLYTALKPDHSWVYWRDVDIVESPSAIIEDFIAHDRDVLVPNIWFHRLHPDGNWIEGKCESSSEAEHQETITFQLS